MQGLVFSCPVRSSEWEVVYAVQGTNILWQQKPKRSVSLMLNLWDTAKNIYNTNMLM